MSGTMSKLLVSGCSYTDDYWTSPNTNSRPAFDKTRRITGFPVWSDFFDADVTNLGKSGLGNDYILNSIVDRLAIEKFDCVIAMWSEFTRVDWEIYESEYSY